MDEPLKAGDPWPKVVLSSLDGEPIDFLHQTRAGMTAIVAFTAEADAAAVAERLAAALAPDSPIALRIVTPGTPQEAQANPPAPLAAPAVHVLSGENLCPRILGIDAGLALIDRRGRVRRALALHAVDEAIAAAKALEQEADAAFAPVLLVPDLLERSLCERIIAYWEGEPKIVNAVAARQAGNASVNADYKRRADVVLRDQTLLGEVNRRIARRLVPEVRKYLRARLVESEAYRIGCYESDDLGGFKRHRDNTTPHTNHRAFAMSLNLNDPSSYEGGSVIFPEFGERLYRPPAGGAVIFSCGLLHEALPVTEGRRFGMFTFFADDEGMKILAERRKKQAGAGQNA